MNGHISEGRKGEKQMNGWIEERIEGRKEEREGEGWLNGCMGG